MQDTLAKVHNLTWSFLFVLDLTNHVVLSFYLFYCSKKLQLFGCFFLTHDLGIYFTSYFAYTNTYICHRKRPAIILSWVIPGMHFSFQKHPTTHVNTFFFVFLHVECKLKQNTYKLSFL